MKSVLYVGATLMIGASIYGFVDYKQTQNKKEFKTMYTEEKKTKPVVTPVVDEPIITERKLVTEKGTDKKELVDVKKSTVSDPKVDSKSSVKKTTVKKTKKKKRLDARLFSRAPLRDEDLEELPVQPVKEEKKIEDKEQ